MRVAFEGLSLRPAVPQDRAYLLTLFAEVRADEFRQAGWPAEQLALFLAHQFELQDRHYRAQYQDADFWIVLLSDQDGGGALPVGRLYRSKHAEARMDRIIEITVTQAFRGRGIGSALVRAVLDDAAARHHDVGLAVEPNNPAMALYKSLGFLMTNAHPVYTEMRWSCGSAENR